MRAGSTGFLLASMAGPGRACGALAGARPRGAGTRGGGVRRGAGPGGANGAARRGAAREGRGHKGEGGRKGRGVRVEAGLWSLARVR